MQPLLIYYGYPALINGSRNLEEAASHFGRYSMVVLGDGLWDGRHPNHDAVCRLVEQLPEVRFFGYVDLGVHSPHHPVHNLQVAEIERRSRAFQAMGMQGILLDDYGYDFANTRERQIEAVNALHGLGLAVIANSWDPRHALDAEAGPGNLRGLASPLRSTDYYLYESYLVSNGQWVGFKQWRAKANTLEKLLRSRKVGVISCTTGGAQALVGPEEWPFIWQCAWLEGHAAAAWGEPNFSASDNQAPWRERPELPTGRRGPARPAGSYSVQCACRDGRALADYATKQVAVESIPPWWKRVLRRTT